GSPAALGKYFLGSGDNRLADATGLFHGVDASDQATGSATKAFRVGGADLVPGRRRQPSGAAHRDTVFPGLRERDPSEVADDIRQQVRPWIADLVQHLLAYGERCDQATGARWLAHAKRAVGFDLDDGE